MAEIFLARVSGLPGFQKMVVIKRILPQLATQADFVEMFLDEARIAATLQHPNVVQMYDVGVVDANYFIAMEYLHGEDVRSLMKTLFRREMKLPLEHALNIVIGVASGLHYAHEKVGFDGKRLEIVHRDVTPQNIIVTYDGAVKLLDFGIAKASNRFGETRFGTLKGKVPYMSPEQCRGEPLDRRSDIFSLGIMLYELTLGKRLYEGKSDFEVLKQIVEGTVTMPRELDPAYPPELEAICMRALEKEADKRYQTAREMQADLEALVRADRLHVSPIALTHYMEEVFGHKIEAWREAQAQGKSLGEHLETIPVAAETALGDDDLEMVGETEAKHQEELARERAEFRKKVEASATSGVRNVDRGAITRALGNPLEDEPPAKVARSNGGLWLVLCSVLVAGAAAIGFVLHSRGAREKVAMPTAATTATVPASAMAVRPTGESVKPTGEPSKPTGDAAKPTGDAARPVVDGGKLVGDAAARAKAHRPKHIATLPETTKQAPLARIQTAETRRQDAAAAPMKLEGEGTLLLASSPWCNVKIDGQDKGPTPVSVKLPAGKHTVVLTNPEFKISRTLPVMILPNETTRKRLDFAQ
ncbi:MAG: Protein kinase [Myxococcales bacterium]|nr:Protein kinase [Myxococcales bacterium]